jgi:hypothetical protein
MRNDLLHKSRNPRLIVPDAAFLFVRRSKLSERGATHGRPEQRLRLSCGRQGRSILPC